MEARLCLLCRWSLQTLPINTQPYTGVTIIVPTRATNTEDYQSSDTYCHWQLKDLNSLVAHWLRMSFIWVEGGHSQVSMYGPTLPKLQDGRDFLTLPCLVTTYKHQIEVAFCGYFATSGDNIAHSYGCRVLMPSYDTFSEAVRRCFEYRTPDNSLYVDYTTKYELVSNALMPFEGKREGGD